ncbi:hypothetical protein AB0J43_00260 [Nonomuraea fuscirosea]
MHTPTVLHLADLMDPSALAEAKKHGYVHEQTHPTLPLSILNYTTQTQVEGHWNKVTKQCRGLIIDTRTGDVLARPLAKQLRPARRTAPDRRPRLGVR